MDVLRVEYDVTGLSQDEIDYLAGEATVQAESSDGHPGVPCTATLERVVGSALVVRLRVTPASGDARNADEIGDAVLAALEAGLGGAPGDLASGNSLTFDGLEIAV